MSIRTVLHYTQNSIRSVEIHGPRKNVHFQSWILPSVMRPFHHMKICRYRRNGSIIDRLHHSNELRAYPLIRFRDCFTSNYLKSNYGSTHVKNFASSTKQKDDSQTNEIKNNIDKGTDESSGRAIIGSDSASQTLGLSAIVESVHKRIPKIEWHVSDLLSVVSIGILFVAIIVVPVMVEKMKSSNNYYDTFDIEEELRHHMESVSKDIHGELVNFLEISQNRNEDDIKSSGNTVDIINDVINSEALRNAITSLVTRIVSSSQFQSACKQLVRNLWNDIIHDPDTTAQIIQLLNTAINNEQIKRSFKILVLELIRDKEVYNELTGLIVRLSKEKAVLDATQQLLTESAHRTLSDPEILDHSMEFASDVVGDDGVQRTSGEALRHTLSYALRPGLSVFLTIAGLGLLALSFSALGQASIVAKEVQEFGAISHVIFSTWEGITIRCVGIGHTLFNIFMSPFRFIAACTSSLIYTSQYCLYGIFNFFHKIISIPISAFRGTMLFLGASADKAVSCFITLWNGAVYATYLPVVAYQRTTAFIGISVCMTHMFLRSLWADLIYIASTPSILCAEMAAALRALSSMASRNARNIMSDAEFIGDTISIVFQHASEFFRALGETVTSLGSRIWETIVSTSVASPSSIYINLINISQPGREVFMKRLSMSLNFATVLIQSMRRQLQTVFQTVKLTDYLSLTRSFHGTYVVLSSEITNLCHWIVNLIVKSRMNNSDL